MSDRPQYSVNPVELLVKQFGETHRQAFAIAIRAAYEQGAEDRLGKIQNYQEAYNLLQSISLTASDLINLLDRLGDNIILQGGEQKFLLDKQNPTRAKLTELIQENFKYLSWHCVRCGNLLPRSNAGAAPVSYQIGGYESVCESCYMALDPRLQGSEQS